jgi:hypothetical protein
MSHRLEEAITDQPEVDMEIYTALRVLDPGERAAGYWNAFHARVTSAAGAELVRRRAAASMTVGDVLVGWARTLVPTAMLAAALAGVVLMRGETTEAPAPLGIEEMLTSELKGLTIPQISSPDAPGNPLLLVAEIF